MGNLNKIGDLFKDTLLSAQTAMFSQAQQRYPIDVRISYESVDGKENYTGHEPPELKRRCGSMNKAEKSQYMKNGRKTI